MECHDQRQVFSGNFDGYCKNISDDLIDLFENKTNTTKCYHLFKNENTTNNQRVGNFVPTSDATTHGAEEDQFWAILEAATNSAVDESKAESKDDLVDIQKVYEQLKCYFKTVISWNMDKLIEQIRINQHVQSPHSLKALLIDLLDIICPEKDIVECIGISGASDIIKYTKIDYLDLLILFFGESNTQSLLNGKKIPPTTNNFQRKLIQFLTTFVNIDATDACFKSLLSTTFAIFFTKSFGTALLNGNQTKIRQSYKKRTLLTIVFDFVIARANLFCLSPQLQLIRDLSEYRQEPESQLSCEDEAYLKELIQYRQLWRELRSSINQHKLMINKVHYNGYSLIHYTCEKDMLYSTAWLMDECKFDCFKVFKRKIGSAFSKTNDNSVVYDMIWEQKQFGSGVKIDINNDIDQVQQQDIHVQFTLESLLGDKSKGKSSGNTIRSTPFKRTIDGDAVLNGLHKGLLNLIDYHTPWNEFLWNMVFKYLQQRKKRTSLQDENDDGHRYNNAYDLAVLVLKTISMILSLSLSHLKSEENLFRQYQKSNILLGELDMDTLKYIKNTLIKKENTDYLSDHCDERICNLFKNHLDILVTRMIETHEQTQIYPNNYPSIGDLLAKFSAVLQDESQNGLYDDILFQTKQYGDSWHDVRQFGKHGDAKLSRLQSSYSNYAISRPISPTSSDNDNKDNSTTNSKTQHAHSRNGSQKIAQWLAGDDQIRPHAAAQEIKLQQLHKLAGELNEEYHKTMENFCNQFLNDDLIVYHRGPMKTQDRIRDKLESKPDSSIDNVLDINRGTVDCFSLPQLSRALEGFDKFVSDHKSGMMKIVRIKNTTENWLKNKKMKKVTYGDIKCNVLFGHNKKQIIGEIQFNLRDIINFQRKIHHFYEIKRLESVSNRMKPMVVIYKVDDAKIYRRYNNSMIKASNKRAFCNSLLYSPEKLCKLAITNDSRSGNETMLEYLGYNATDEKRTDMFRLSLDYLLYFAKHFGSKDDDFLSNYLCKQSFYNQPFHKSTAFGINCKGMKDNSRNYRIIKHILDSITISDDISIDIQRISRQKADLSQLYLLWCDYLHHNKAIQKAIVSFDFIASIGKNQRIFMSNDVFVNLKEQLKMTFGVI